MSLAPWYSALQDVIDGVADARVLCIGTSTTAGADSTGNDMGSNASSASWPRVLASIFTAAPASPASWLGSHNVEVASTTLSAYDSRITLGSGWAPAGSAPNVTLSCNFMAGPASTAAIGFAPGASFDRATVWYRYATTGPEYTVNINGGSSIGTLDMQRGSGPGIGEETFSFTGGSHTFNVVSNGTAGGRILGVMAWNSASKAVHFLNAGWFGGLASEMAGNTDASYPLGAIAAISPHLTILYVGENDRGWGGTGETAFKNALRAIADAAEGVGSGLLFVGPQFSEPGFGGEIPNEATQTTFNSWIGAVAAEYSAPFLNIIEQTGWTTYATAGSNGYNSATPYHPSATGYAAIAELIRQQIDAVPAVSTPLEDQDVDIERAAGVNTIIRFLLQAEGDPSGKAFTLRARKNGSGSYAVVPVGSPVTGTINNQPVAAGADDAQQSGSTMTVTGTTLGASLDATTEYVGIRFGSVAIPKGATITTAYMRVVPSATGEDEPLVTIAGFAEDNTAAFTTTANDITVRATTTATASWSSTDLGATGSSYHNTPSLVSIVQEIIDRSGWATGNAIGFRIQGGATTTRDLTIESYENTGNNPPQLYVEYSYSPEVYISPSANIAAGGEATTQRLSGGTGTFTTGRIWDDENGSDSIDIGADGNTEIAWCVRLAESLEAGDYFDFLVYDGDTPLDGTAARWTVEADGGPVELVVADSVHGHTADSMGLSQANTLSIGGSAHAHMSDNVTLSQASTLLVGESVHAQSADGVDLTQAAILVPGESVHAQTSNQLVLTQAGALQVGDSSHGHHAHIIALAQAYALEIADSIHAQASDQPSLIQDQLLEVADSVHVHIAGGVGLTQANMLAVADAIHAHVAEAASLSSADFIAIGELVHGHASDAPTLVQASILTVGESVHTLVSAEIRLSEAVVLALGDAVHGLFADGVELSHAAMLAIASAVHLHAAGAIGLTQATTIVVSDSAHAHIARQINLLMPGGPVVPPGRTIIVQARSRVIVIQPESRTSRVH